MCENHVLPLTIGCAICNEQIDNDLIVMDSDNNDICQDCAKDEDYTMCVDCGCYSQDTNYVNDDNYCENCITDNHSFCGYCGEWHHNDDFEEVRTSYCSTEQVCKDRLESDSRYEECSDCGEWQDRHNADYAYNSSDDFVCRSCLYDNYTYCERHNTYEPRGEECSYSDLISGDNPPIRFHKADKDTEDEPFFGIENELDDGDPNSIHECDGFNRLYTHKTDGSLSSDGVETVTAPMTLRYHQSQFNWKQLLNMMGNADYRGTSDCGVHIHCNKTALDETQWLWLEDFILEFSYGIQALAGRQATSYCTYRRAETGMYLGDRGKIRNTRKAIVKNKIGHERYRAVNFNNRDTVEVRIFQGTTSRAAILSYIELYHALIMLARKNTYELRWSNLMAYVFANKDRYANLISKIKDKGVIK